MTTHSQNIVAAADRLKAILADQLATLASQRLEVWCSQLHQRFPRLHGDILFGMGSESIRIAHKLFDVDRKGLCGLNDAMEDVWEICDSYRLACPDDFQF